MKNLQLSLALTLGVSTLAGCSLFETTSTPMTLSSEQSLVTLSYLSGGFLSLESSASTTTLSSSLGYRSLNESIGAVESTTSSTGETPSVAEENIDTISVYLDQLQALIDNGTDSLASVNVAISDDEMYAHLLIFIVRDDIYKLYYNTTNEGVNLEGLMYVDDVSYQFTAKNYLEDRDELEDDDEDQEDDDEDQEDDDDLEDLSQSIRQTLVDNESEQKMEFVAINGEDEIRMTYKVETEGDESELKLEMTKVIAGVTTEIEIKISEEDGESKVEVYDGDDYYKFKREINEEGVEFKLQYSIGGVSGEIKAASVTDEFGNVTYLYKIVEDGKHAEIEDRPELDDDEDDDETDDDLRVIV